MSTTLRPVDAPPRLSYRPALDGLRAISVLAVIFYHGDVGWLPGGFLGVEVFFVVSGFLITALLLDERHHSGGISLRDFWLRRARRLLPALYLLLIVVSASALLVYRDAAGRMGGDVIAALLYVSNWWQIYLQESYFAQAGRPPLLRHLWSLAVEEQFYLLFPPLFVLGLAKLGWRTMRWVLVGVAVLSAAWMAYLYEPFQDPSRIYYGTDTRLSGLLLGAFLAMVWSPWRARAQASRSAGPVLNLAGILGLAAMLWFFMNVNEFDAFVYRGGFLLLDLVCLVVIAVIVHPAAVIDRFLGLSPLVWVGKRSYAIYLWHWPIFMVTRPELDWPVTGWPDLLIRVGLTIGAADLSYRYVEEPMRRGALGRWWHDLRASSGDDRAVLARQGFVFGGAVCCAVLLVGVGLQAAASSPDRNRLELEATSAAPDNESGDATEPTTETTTAPANGQAPGATTLPSTSDAGVTQTATDATAVGDSVMLGASSALKAAMPGIFVDAKVARQFDSLEAETRYLIRSGRVPGPLILHCGTNGTFSDDDLDRIFDMAGNRKVLLINSKVERPWQDLVNHRLADGAQRHSNAVLVDWYGLASEHPEWFVGDGAHLRPDGAQAFAELIRSNL
jgi:peptidoglycan/LPS O-acetylase OafA/YrhL